jgi:hypothetical protein
MCADPESSIEGEKCACYAPESIRRPSLAILLFGAAGTAQQSDPRWMRTFPGGIYHCHHAQPDRAWHTRTPWQISTIHATIRRSMPSLISTLIFRHLRTYRRPHWVSSIPRSSVENAAIWRPRNASGQVQINETHGDAIGYLVLLMVKIDYGILEQRR